MKKLLIGGVLLAGLPGLAVAQLTGTSGGPATSIAPAVPPAGLAQTPGTRPALGAPPPEMVAPSSGAALAPGFPIGGAPTFGGGTTGALPPASKPR
jgi:hypothetical protein